jgi:hypothetical protein
MFQPYWNYTFSILFAICKEMKSLVSTKKIAEMFVNYLNIEF